MDNTEERKPRRKLTPWQKIMRAARRGTGLHLSPEEVGRLSMDDAIESVAENDDREDATGEDW